MAEAYCYCVYKIQYYKIPTEYTIDCYARSTRAYDEPSQYIEKLMVALLL